MSTLNNSFVLNNTLFVYRKLCINDCILEFCTLARLIFDDS